MLEFSTPPSAHHILHAYTPPTTSSQRLTSQCTYWLPHSPHPYPRIPRVSSQPTRPLLSLISTSKLTPW